jgi:hypothetical protein
MNNNIFKERVYTDADATIHRLQGPLETWKFNIRRRDSLDQSQAPSSRPTITDMWDSRDSGGPSQYHVTTTCIDLGHLAHY